MRKRQKWYPKSSISRGWTCSFTFFEAFILLKLNQLTVFDYDWEKWAKIVVRCKTCFWAILGLVWPFLGVHYVALDLAQEPSIYIPFIFDIWTSASSSTLLHMGVIFLPFEHVFLPFWPWNLDFFVKWHPVLSLKHDFYWFNCITL